MRGRKIATVRGIIHRFEHEIRRLVKLMHPIWKYGVAYEHQKSWQDNSFLMIHNIIEDLVEIATIFPDEALASFVAKRHDMLCGLIGKGMKHNIVMQMLVILLDARDQLVELEEAEEANDKNRT